MRKPVAWKARLARELGQPGKMAILGVGNVAKGDDAAGVRIAETLAADGRVRRMPRLKVFVTYEAPENFTGAVRASGADVVLVLDAAAGGFPPGTIHFVDPGRIVLDDVSTHRTPLSTLAEFLEKTAGCRVVILGIEPETLAPGSRMTPGVRAAAAEAAAYLAALALRRLA